LCPGGPVFAATQASLVVLEFAVSGSLIKSAGMATEQQSRSRYDSVVLYAQTRALLSGVRMLGEREREVSSVASDWSRGPAVP
jgi:hypothetical protein